VKELNMSIRSFELSLGMPNGTIAQFTDNTSRETLSRISEKYPQFDVDYVITGRRAATELQHIKGVPVRFVTMLFEERKMHDGNMSKIIDESAANMSKMIEVHGNLVVEHKKSGERIDSLIGIIREHIGDNEH